MPTFETTSRFDKDLARLTLPQKEQFKECVREFVEDLKRNGIIRPKLGVRSIQKTKAAIFEFHWEYHNGRATFQYGEQRRQGEAHIIWRRIGTHAIYDDP